MSRITEDELCSFITDFLKSKLREKTVQDEIGKGKESDKNKRWDTAARHVIGEKIKQNWLNEYFGSEEVINNRLTEYFRYEGDKGEQMKRAKVFSCRCYPDIWFSKPFKIAIELDHGNKGSALKNALTKASFDNLVGDWKKVFIIFFDKSNNKRITKQLDDNASREVLKFYQEHFNTEVIMI